MAKKKTTKKRAASPLIPAERIEQSILLIRGEKVMLDSDLATLYEVETKVLNQAVKRNISRFPADFMFQLSKDEFDDLKSQFVTSSWGGRRTPPYAFTEQGVAMLSSVLRSERAVQVNVEIMRRCVSQWPGDRLLRRVVSLATKHQPQPPVQFHLPNPASRISHPIPPTPSPKCCCPLPHNIPA